MILDLFAGPGGWDEGLLSLGRTDVLGVELDADACATAEAAGHKRLKADVRTLDPFRFPRVEGLIASPPCQTFSDAGLSEGQASLDGLAAAARMVAGRASVTSAAAANGLDKDDPRSTLVLEPLRFIRDLRPEWVACEEVPPVLPVWQVYATILRSFGYSTWAGILNAADYGVPQSRKRSFLLASRTRWVQPPRPTHAKGGDVDLFGEFAPWVTMAEALGWAERPSGDGAWAWDRPATTIVRSFCPDVVAGPGYRQAGDGPRQNAPGSFHVTPEQMCMLQGIRTDYPFKGAKTKRLSLIGAVLPPPWAAAILATLIPSRWEEVA